MRFEDLSDEPTAASAQLLAEAQRRNQARLDARVQKQAAYNVIALQIAAAERTNNELARTRALVLTLVDELAGLQAWVDIHLPGRPELSTDA